MSQIVYARFLFPYHFKKIIDKSEFKYEKNLTNKIYFYIFVSKIYIYILLPHKIYRITNTI